MVDQDLSNPKNSPGAVSGVSTANLQTMKDDLAKVLSATKKQSSVLSSVKKPETASLRTDVRPPASLPADSDLSGKSPVLNPIFGIMGRKGSSWGFMKNKTVSDKTVENIPPSSLPVEEIGPATGLIAKPSAALADLRSKLTSLKTSSPDSSPAPALPVSQPAASALSPIAPPIPRFVPPPPTPPPSPVEPAVPPVSPPPPPRPTPPPVSAPPKPASPVPSASPDMPDGSRGGRVARPSVLAPHEPELPSIDIDEEEESGWSRKKLIIVALGSVIIVVGVVSFIVTGGSEVSKEPTTPPVQTPAVVYQEKDPLFSRAVLNLRASVSEQDFFDDLATFSVASAANGEFTKIIISGADNKPLSFEQFLDYSGIFLPIGTLEPAPNAFFADDFVFYSYKGVLASNFAVAVPLADNVLAGDISRFMSGWEATFADDWFFLLKGLAGAASTLEFQDSARAGVMIRYKNFPTPDLAIDYAVAGDYLLISSSRESMFASIDALAR